MIRPFSISRTQQSSRWYAAAGLVTEILFGAAGLVPGSRPLKPVPVGFRWDYTTYLNLAFLAVFGVLYWLHRNRARFGSGAGYAIDPVCGMQVEIALAPARAVHDGHPVYFCSDHCRERFEAAPVRYLKPGRPPARIEMTPAQPQPQNDDDAMALDPVCGMTIAKATAAATREHGGKTFYFCMEGCAQSFAADPEKYLVAR